MKVSTHCPKERLSPRRTISKTFWSRASSLSLNTVHLRGRKRETRSREAASCARRFRACADALRSEAGVYGQNPQQASSQQPRANQEYQSRSELRRREHPPSTVLAHRAGPSTSSFFDSNLGVRRDRAKRGENSECQGY